MTELERELERKELLKCAVCCGPNPIGWFCRKCDDFSKPWQALFPIPREDLGMEEMLF